MNFKVTIILFAISFLAISQESKQKHNPLPINPRIGITESVADLYKGDELFEECFKIQSTGLKALIEASDVHARFEKALECALEAEKN